MSFSHYRELIFLWSKLQLKSNPSKQVFVDQCYQLLRTATNVRVIFPFMKIIKDEVNIFIFQFLDFNAASSVCHNPFSSSSNIQHGSCRRKNNLLLLNLGIIASIYIL
jgi:hypothetical protein